MATLDGETLGTVLEEKISLNTGLFVAGLPTESSENAITEDIGGKTQILTVTGILKSATQVGEMNNLLAVGDAFNENSISYVSDKLGTKSVKIATMDFTASGKDSTIISYTIVLVISA